MVNLTEEKLLTLQQVAAIVPVSYTTLFRYHKYGHRGVKLETYSLGGRVVTTLENVQRFMAQVRHLDEQQELAPLDAQAMDETHRALRDEFGI